LYNRKHLPPLRIFRMKNMKKGKRGGNVKAKWLKGRKVEKGA
jgi:hypothetical protein